MPELVVALERPGLLELNEQLILPDDLTSGYEFDASYTGSEISIGFVAAFEDSRQDKYGHFTLSDCRQPYMEIFRRIIEIEPSICHAGYILGNIRQPRQNIGLSSVEYHQKEIQALLAKLRKPGIVRRA